MEWSRGLASASAAAHAVPEVEVLSMNASCTFSDAHRLPRRDLDDCSVPTGQHDDCLDALPGDGDDGRAGGRAKGTPSQHGMPGEGAGGANATERQRQNELTC